MSDPLQPATGPGAVALPAALAALAALAGVTQAARGAPGDGGASDTAGAGTDLRVEPDLPVLPANHLKFYLHFGEPMERGEVFRHLRLAELDGSGAEAGEVPEPFREVELWDESFTRLTLWLHPGRQKPGVNLNVEIGPVLEEGRRYRLEVSGAWRTETGAPLGRIRGHSFSAGPLLEEQPDPQRWEMEFEGAALTVHTGAPLDPESLRHRVAVLDGADAPVSGLELETFPQGFRLRRESRWPPGDYRLRVDPRLEDLAGNSPARPFNLDLESRPGFAERREEFLLPFRVPPP